MWGRTAVVGDSVLLAFAFALGLSELIEAVFGGMAEWAGAAGLPLGLALGIWVARILNRWRTRDPLTRAQTRGMTLAITAVVALAIATLWVQGEWVGSGWLQPSVILPILTGAVAAALLLDAVIDLTGARDHLVLDAVRMAALVGIGLALVAMAHPEPEVLQAAVYTFTLFSVVVAVVAVVCDVLASRRLNTKARRVQNAPDGAA